MLNLLKEAWISIGINMFRTFLTMLGIIIGVWSVILMLSIGQGAQTAIKETIAAMGSNLLIVLSGASTSGGIRYGAGTAVTLSVDDAAAIGQLNEIAYVAPSFTSSAQIIYESNNWSTIVMGSVPDYLQVRDWTLSSGASFTSRDLRSASCVALIGKTVNDNLFNKESPIGKTIRINKVPFQVIGTLTPKGQSLTGQDQDDVIIIPLTTSQRKVFGTSFPGKVRFIMVKTKEADDMVFAQEKITELLRARHKIGPKMDDDFSIRNLSEVAAGAQNSAYIMSLLLGAVASVSLLVGGIGIMNIMLVSVSERTREIGIRKAIGAPESAIMIQFFFEAIVITSVGSFLGLILGIASSFAVKSFFNMPAEVTIWSLVVSVLVAAIIGLFFGYYPARKAALLNPIEALRYQ